MKLLTVREVAKQMHVQPATVRGWIREGKFANASKQGRGYLIPADDVVNLILNGRKNA